MSSLSFENAKFHPGRGPLSTVITDGLNVNQPVTGKHLSTAFGTDNLANIDIGYAQIFAASNQYYGKPLVGMTEAKGKVKLIDRQGFRWELSGGNDQRARITRLVCTDPKPGVNLGTFDIVVDKPWFNVSDIIIPQDNRYRFRVEPQTGTNSRTNRQLGPNEFRYTLRMVTDDPTKYCLPEFIQLQQEWIKQSSAVATEDNVDAGGFQFYSIFESEGQTQQHAVKFGVTDKAARRAYQAAQRGDWSNDEYGKYLRMLWVKFEDKVKGEPLARFMAVFDATALNELYQNVENTLMFGTYSTSLVSPEGHQILTSSGLREQLESGWTLQHNGNLTLEQLEDWFDSIMKDKISEGEQKIVLSAGREFRKMFDRMIKADARSFVTLDTMYLRQGESFRHLDYGSYFAHYKGFSVDISVMENPAYDNRNFCPRMHPVKTNTTVDSWRADILDFGSANQQGSGTTTDNICMVVEEHLDYHITYNGKYYAHEGKSGMPIVDGGLGNAGGISGYSVMREKNAGLMVADPTRCGSIFLAPSTY